MRGCRSLQPAQRVGPRPHESLNRSDECDGGGRAECGNEVWPIRGLVEDLPRGAVRSRWRGVHAADGHVLDEKPGRDRPRGHREHDRTSDASPRVVLPHTRNDTECERRTRARCGDGSRSLQHADPLRDGRNHRVDLVRLQLEVAPVVGEAFLDAPCAFEHYRAVVGGFRPIRHFLEGDGEGGGGVVPEHGVRVPESRHERTSRQIGDPLTDDVVQHVQPRPSVGHACRDGAQRNRPAVLLDRRLEELDVLERAGVPIGDLRRGAVRLRCLL